MYAACVNSLGQLIDDVKGQRRPSHALQWLGQFLGVKRVEGARKQKPYRQAHYSKEAIYQLPFTIAEGLGSRHAISRKDFLKKIESQMTRREKERLQQSARAHGHTIKGALERMDLTRLCAMVLGLKREERIARREELEGELRDAAQRAVGVWPYHADSIALVLDNSYSSSASRSRKQRSLVVAFALMWLARAMCAKVQTFWTPPSSWRRPARHTIGTDEPRRVSAPGARPPARADRRLLRWV